jgi:site-specific DNA-methyltransferase (cytosine-N4-specific)
MIEKWDKLFEDLGSISDTSPWTMFCSQHEVLYNVWCEVTRVLVDGGIACINVGDATRSFNKHFYCFPNFAKTTMAMQILDFTPLIPIIWRKISNRPNAFLGSGMIPPNGYIAQDCEYIGIYRKGNRRVFKPHDLQRYASEFTKEERDIWFQQVWSIPGAMGAKATSAFPTEVPKRLIQMFSCLDEVVLDPFSGTGTTSQVCEELERKFIGYEINENDTTKR